MSQKKAFDLTKDFIENNSLFTTALKYLDPNTEIRILLNFSEECALFVNTEGLAQIEMRSAKNPDVEFGLSLETVRKFNSFSQTELGSLAIDIIKEVIAGHITIKVCGPITNLLKKGYLALIKEAGPELKKILTQHGVKGFYGIVLLFKKLKNR